MDNEEMIAKKIGLESKYRLRDLMNRIDELLSEEQAAKRQRNKIELYKLALQLQDSKTPLTDIAAHLDMHDSEGAVSCIQADNVSALCRELEAGNTRDK